jgi:hypothetical protein
VGMLPGVGKGSYEGFEVGLRLSDFFCETKVSYARLEGRVEIPSLTLKFRSMRMFEGLISL